MGISPDMTILVTIITQEPTTMGRSKTLSAA